MNKVLLLIFVLMLCANVALAAGGLIGIYSDPFWNGFCNLWDLPPAGVRHYYVVVSHGDFAMGVQYRAQLPLCMTQTGAFWIADENMFQETLGNSQDGIRIIYDECKIGIVVLQIVSVFGLGTTPECCLWHVDADPNSQSGEIQVFDCDLNVFYQMWSPGGIINPTSDCYQCIVPVEQTTWGQVKALYGE